MHENTVVTPDKNVLFTQKVLVDIDIFKTVPINVDIFKIVPLNINIFENEFIVEIYHTPL